MLTIISYERQVGKRYLDCSMPILRSARIVMCFCAVLCITASAEANTYYVSTSGSDSNSGTIEQPFRTVNRAVRVLKAGDTLYIRGGTYVDRFVDTDFTAGGTATAPILVSGYPGEKVVIKNGGTDGITGFMMAGREYIEIQDMTLDGSTANVGDVVILFNNNVTFRRVEITGGWKNGILGGGSGHRFIDLKVHGNGRQPAAEYSAGHNGVYMASDNVLVQRGEFYDNQCYGIRFMDSDPAGRAENNKVLRAKVYGNGWGKGLGGTSRCGSGGGGIVIGDTSNTVDESLVYDNLHGVEVIGGKMVENAKILNSVICGNAGRGIGFGLWAGATGTQILDNLLCQNPRAIENQAPANTSNTQIVGNIMTFDGDFVAAYAQRVGTSPPPTATAVAPTPPKNVRVKG